MSLHLRDVLFWSWREESLRRGDLRVEPGPRGSIVAVDACPKDAKVIEGRGRLALEGFACAHHHLYSGLARGMPAPTPPPRGFLEILERVWWRLDRSLDPESVRASAWAAGLEALACGTTSIVDHHASPRAIEGSLGSLAETLDAVGSSSVLCYELSDRDGPDVAERGLTETDSFLESGRAGLVGLHASFTVGDELLHRAVALARKHGVGLHVHVAEDLVDQERCVAEHGCRVVERLERAGALDLPGTLLAHCLHLDDHERELVARSSAWVVVNAESNQNNGVGHFRRRGLDPARILLGTDGMHGDMLRAARATAFAGGDGEGLDLAGSWRALWNNQRYLEIHHPAVASANDLVLFDYDPPTPLSEETLLGHVFFGLDARHVSTVIAQGRVVLDERRPTQVDAAKILRQCRERSHRLREILERPPSRSSP